MLRELGRQTDWKEYRMKNQLSWRTLMETRTEKRSYFQGPALVAVVVTLHVIAVGSIVMIQGCGVTRTARVEPPPAPTMPPTDVAVDERPVTPAPSPVFQPPVATDPEPTPPAADLNTYEVRRGDNLSTIASRHGVTTAELVDLNQLSDPNAIRIGQKLLLPAHARVRTPAPAPAATPAQPAPAAQRPAVDGATYVVQSGDSLSRIAQQHGVSTARLAEANQLSDPNQIRVGQELVIPGVTETRSPAERTTRTPQQERTPEPTPEPVREEPVPAPSPAPAPAQPELSMDDAFPYPVRSGDTLDQIARDFSVLKEDLLRANNMTGDETLRPGQTILVPPPSGP